MNIELATYCCADERAKREALGDREADRESEVSGNEEQDADEDVRDERAGDCERQDAADVLKEEAALHRVACVVKEQQSTES